MGLGKGICLLAAVFIGHMITTQVLAEQHAGAEIAPQNATSTERDEYQESFCLSAGLLQHYRCDSNSIEAQIAAGQRYSIQLLSVNEAMPDLPEALSVFHRIQLSGNQAFVYIGEFTEQQEALDTMMALVMVGTLDPDHWRLGVVQIDKSRQVPSVRLVQMYKDKSFSHLAVSEVASDSLSFVGDDLIEGRFMPSYYTAQIAGFSSAEKRLEFIQRKPNMDFICRTRRNGKLVVYSGAFPTREELRFHIQVLKRKGLAAYELKLSEEDMYDCEDQQKIVLYSKTQPVKVLPVEKRISSIDQVGSTAKATSIQANLDSGNADKTKVDVKPDTRISGLQSLANINLGDSSISQALLSFVGDDLIEGRFMPSYYTAQIASFSSAEKRLEFIQRKPNMDFICRTRRNGKLVVYSGAFPTREELRFHIQVLKRKGLAAYELKLSEEDMYDCEDQQKIVLYSKTQPVKVLPVEKRVSSIDQVGSTAKATSIQANLDSGNADKTKVDVKPDTRISGLQSLANINLGDSSISQALSAMDNTSLSEETDVPVSRRKNVVQLDVIAPEKSREKVSSAVIEEEATALPAYYLHQQSRLALRQQNEPHSEEPTLSQELSEKPSEQACSELKYWGASGQ